MTQAGLSRILENGGLDSVLAGLYPGESGVSRRGRVLSILTEHRERFGPAETRLFSAPGRTELGGNHTDHNGGRVLAAAVDLDILAAVSPAAGGTAEIASRGFPRIFRADLSRLEPVSGETGKTEALVRGTAAGFAARGLRYGAFRAAADGRVLPGSGLSSSAAFEVLLAAVQNALYNAGTVPPAVLAEIGWEAENVHFGKPCGRMDQTACALGGISAMDFADPAAPRIEKIDFDFAAAGYALFVVHTGDGHEDLTADYAAIPAEMRSVAAAFGKKVLRDLGDIPPRDLIRRAAPLRGGLGDRALLRACHFFAENRRAASMGAALRERRTGEYLRLVRDSGDSSWKLLQNCHPPSLPGKQGIPLALLMAEEFLAGEGACRVHGGGFAGTIQAYVPRERAREFAAEMDGIFGAGSARELRIRPEGPIEIGPEG